MDTLVPGVGGGGGVERNWSYGCSPNCLFPHAELTVQFVPDTYQVTEGEMVQFTIQLSDPADRPVTVRFTTMDGSAGKLVLQCVCNKNFRCQTLSFEEI